MNLTFSIHNPYFLFHSSYISSELPIGGSVWYFPRSSESDDLGLPLLLAPTGFNFDGIVLGLWSQEL